MKQDELLWSNAEFNEDTDWEEESSYLGNLLNNYAEEKVKDCSKLLVKANNINWQGRNGHKIIELSDEGLVVARQIIPQYDNNFRLYVEDDGSMYATVSSHDVPTGGVWNFVPIKDYESVFEDIRCADTTDEIKDVLKKELGIELEMADITEKSIELNYVLDSGKSKLIQFGDKLIVVELNEDGEVCYFFEFDDLGLEQEYFKTL